MMSGTSFDAIDAAAADIELEGDVLHLRPLGSLSAPYDDDLREALAAALPPAQTTLATVCRLDTRIGQAFAELAAAAVERFGGADLIASHGQTLFHWVEDGRVEGTLQVGQPAWIAERTGLPVVSDFRARDVAAGGQGAPLVSLLDTLLLADRPGVPAALEPGRDREPDDSADRVRRRARQRAASTPPHATSPARPFDDGGRLAAAGTVIPGLLDRLLEDPYYARPAPKSTGKEHFNAAYLDGALDHAPRTCSRR